jgi:cell division protein FtsN
MKYVFFAVVLFAGMEASNRFLGIVPAVLVNSVLLVLFTVYIVKKDFPLSSLPVIGKHFR